MPTYKLLNSFKLKDHVFASTCVIFGMAELQKKGTKFYLWHEQQKENVQYLRLEFQLLISNQILLPLARIYVQKSLPHRR